MSSYGDHNDKNRVKGDEPNHGETTGTNTERARSGRGQTILANLEDYHGGHDGHDDYDYDHYHDDHYHDDDYGL